MKPTPSSRQIRDSAVLVFSQPLMLVVSLFWSLLLLGIVLWLPNIELLYAAFSNASVGFLSRLSLLIEIYQLVFKFFGLVQLFLVLLFLVGTTVSTGLFLRILRAQHQTRITRAKSNPALLANVSCVGLSMIGLMLLVPVITANGLVYEFDVHGPGLFITLVGLIGMGWSTYRLAALLANLDNHS